MASRTLLVKINLNCSVLMSLGIQNAMVTLETSFKVILSLIRQWYTVLILGIQVDDFLPKINGSTEKGSVKNLNIFLSW